MQLIVILAYDSFKYDLSIKLAGDRRKVESLRDKWLPSNRRRSRESLRRGLFRGLIHR
jgi:hypothetical protein